MDLDSIAKAAAQAKNTQSTGVNLDAIAQQAAAAKSSKHPQADMSFWGRLKDNVVGVNDGIMSPGEKLATALNMGGESMTLGVVGDEAAAAADSLVGRGNYASRRDKYRQDEKQFSKENPKLSFAAQVAPAFLPGMGAIGAVGKAASVGSGMLRGALIGAGSGATYGFMEGEGGVSNRLKDAGWSAAAGSLFGGAASGAVAGLSKVPAMVKTAFGRADKRPTVENLRAAKRAAYSAVDQSGEKFSGAETKKLYDTVASSFNDANYVPEVDNASRAVLSILDKNAGKELSVSKLDKIRQGLWARYNSAKDQPHILDAIHAIDDLMESKAGTSELMAAARAANKRFSKAEMLDKAFKKADDQVASTGSGGNTVNKYRQVVTSIINDPKKARFFSDSEVELMRAFVRGSRDENIKRLVGKMSPSGNGLMMTLHILAGVGTNGATIPFMALGSASKKAAEKSALRGAEAIKDSVAGFVRPQQITRVAPAATATAPLSYETQSALRNRLAPSP